MSEQIGEEPEPQGKPEGWVEGELYPGPSREEEAARQKERYAAEFPDGFPETVAD